MSPDAQAVTWIIGLAVVVASLVAAGFALVIVGGRARLVTLLFSVALLIYFAVPAYMISKCGSAPCPSSKLVP